MVVIRPLVRVGHRLGNANNGLTDGPGYLNLNNEASIANWNCGVGEILLNQYINPMPLLFLHPWQLKRCLLAITGRISGNYTEADPLFEWSCSDSGR